MKVSRRGGFSDRNSINPEKTEIQIASLDERTVSDQLKSPNLAMLAGR